MRSPLPMNLAAMAICASTVAVAQQPGSPFAPGGPLEVWRGSGPAATTARLSGTRSKKVNSRPQRIDDLVGGGYPSSSWWVEEHLGLGTPRGNFGLGLDLQPFSLFALNFGAGLSLDGLQLAVTPRVRLPLGKVALSLGWGYSTGPYRWNNQPFAPGGGEQGDPIHKSWDHAKWSNVEVSFEWKPAPLGIRLYGGYATLLNTNPSRCDRWPERSCDDGYGSNVWYVGGAGAFGGAL